jgi:hypothetical protein
MKNETHHQEFTRILTSLHPHQRLATTFHDFCRCAAIALAQPFYRSEELEREYMSIVQRYSSDQCQQFAHLLSVVVMALEDNSQQDFLGEIFAAQNLCNNNKGQFFTPYSIASMMAKISVSEHEKTICQRGYISVCEPCCGSGVMIIALRQAMIESTFNPSSQMLVTCIDIDPLCCDMAYIQLSLLGIAATIIHGDALSMEFHRSVCTPAYFWNNWEQRCTSAENHARLLAIMRSLDEYQGKEHVDTTLAVSPKEGHVQRRAHKGQEQQLMLW